MNEGALAASILVMVLAWPSPARATLTMIPNEGGDSCIAQVREAGPVDVLMRERDPLLGAPENANNAPGPGALRAVVRSDSLHHPFIYVVDTATGASRKLCSGSRPRFSPDGRWIACSRWVSRARPWNLALVDAKTGAIRMLERVGRIEDFAWSPDSKRLAFTSMAHDSSPGWGIGWFDVINDSMIVLASDTDPYVDYFDCEWSPDGRRFVAARRRESEHDDSVFACDLWLFDVNGNVCRLTSTPRRDEIFPGWIDNRRIRYEESEWTGEEWMRRVVELRRN